MIGCGNERSSTPCASSRRSAAGIHVVVLRQHPVVGRLAGVGHDGLIVLRQLVVFLQIDHEVKHRAAFPPAGRVVVLGDLHEAEFLVVVGTDEFRRVDGAALERREDVAGRDLLRHDAELRQHVAAEAADAELETLQIIDGR